LGSGIGVSVCFRGIGILYKEVFEVSIAMVQGIFVLCVSKIIS